MKSNAQPKQPIDAIEAHLRKVANKYRRAAEIIAHLRVQLARRESPRARSLGRGKDGHLFGGP